MLDIDLAPVEVQWSARVVWTPVPQPPPLRPVCPRCHSDMSYCASNAYLACRGCPLLFWLTVEEVLACDAYWFGVGLPPPVSLPAYLAEMALRRFGVLAGEELPRLDPARQRLD